MVTLGSIAVRFRSVKKNASFSLWQNLDKSSKNHSAVSFLCHWNCDDISSLVVIIVLIYIQGTAGSQDHYTRSRSPLDHTVSCSWMYFLAVHWSRWILNTPNMLKIKSLFLSTDNTVKNPIIFIWQTLTKEKKTDYNTKKHIPHIPHIHLGKLIYNS